jgi:hypothetical protein
LNGNPVPTSASCIRVHFETRMRRSLRKAPRPLLAVNSSFFTGSYTTPCDSAPRCSTAIETQYCGKPWMKLVVPSSGSMIQRYSACSALAPDSSARNPCPG